MNNREKRLFIILIFGALFLSLIPFINSAPDYSVNITSPKTWNNYTGTLNVSIGSNVTSVAEKYNVTLYCNSTGGSTVGRAAASMVKVATIWNASAASQLFENAAVSISGIDGMGYNCSAYADNGSYQYWSIARNNITFDSTSPSCSANAEQSAISGNGFNIISWSVSDGLSLVDYSVSIPDINGLNTSFSTTSGTQTIQANSQTGTWILSIGGIDRSGNTCSSSATYTSSGGGAVGGGYVPIGGIRQSVTGNGSETTQTGNTNTYILIGVLAFAVFIIILAVGLSKKSSSRHRRIRRR